MIVGKRHPVCLSPDIMKSLAVFIISTLIASSSTFAASTSDREEIKLPLIVTGVENNFHPMFDDKPIECSEFIIRLDPLNRFDKEWLVQHGGKLLVLTQDNTIIKIGDGAVVYKLNKKYNVVEKQGIEIYNKDVLVFKTDYTNFKNMMSYADHTFSFNFIPVTMVFSDCNE